MSKKAKNPLVFDLFNDQQLIMMINSIHASYGSLYITNSYVDQGPTMKRFRPRAMGRATPIRKRSSHLTITISEKK